MVTRIGGLASGMDIDSLVEKLMNAERAPLNKLNQKKITYEWQRDAYRGVNTKLKTFDTYIADNLVLKSLNSKTASSTNSSLVSATATGAATGTLSIEGVSQLATNARAVGNQVSAIGSTKMSDLGAIGNIELKAIQADGTLAKDATKIEITSDMTVDQFVSKVNNSNAGVNAVFENGRFSFTAKNSGDLKSGEEMQITGGKAIFEKLGFFKDENNQPKTNFQTTEGKNAIFQVNGIATERSSNTFSISGYNVTLKDTFNSTQTIADKYSAAKTELDLATTNKTNKAGVLNTAATKYYGSTSADRVSYTNAHNVAYTAAFGNTLSPSQQEVYSKLSKDDWKNLTSVEFGVINNLGADLTLDEIKESISNNLLIDEASKNKLTNLSEDKLRTLQSINGSTFNVFKEHVNYEAYGTKLKDLTESGNNALRILTVSDGGNSVAIDADTDILKIHEAIDANANFSDVLKTALKSMNKEDLLVLKNSTAETLRNYALKANADDLKSKFNQLGNETITAITNDPSKVATLAEAKADIWNNLSTGQKTAFANLATQNVNRASYVNAVSEDKAADSRVTNAQNTFNTAKTDATKAEILNGSGEIDKDKVNAAPKAQAVTMTSTTNVDDMMTKIKEFVSTYNGLIKDLNDQTKESKYRDYAPLTAEQKKDMDENEIKLWEEKAKSGLLRNDSLIRNGLSNMRSLIYQSNPGIEDTKYNTLFNIGITTSKNYNDGGTLEIDEAKLRKALEENPDAVEKLFKNTGGKKDDVVNGKTVDTRGYLEKLRESMKSLEINIEKKAGRSTMTDAQYTIGKNLMDTEVRIKSWQDKLKNVEARYWKQFTAMESAINKSNQQSSMFMQG